MGIEETEEQLNQAVQLIKMLLADPHDIALNKKASLFVKEFGYDELKYYNVIELDGDENKLLF